MSFYSGSANSFADLRQALIDACVAEGWAFADGILSKGAAYVMPYVSTTQTLTEGPGLIIQGGTGAAGSALTGASDVRPRLGRPGGAAVYEDIVFPVSYNVHVFDGPDEVYLFINYNVDRHGWLAFGLSDLPVPGSGMWLAGIARRGFINFGAGYSISTNSTATGGGNNVTAAQVGPGIFWCTARASDANARQDTIHANIDGEGWTGAGNEYLPNAFNAIRAALPLISYQPNAWNSEGCLIPITGLVWRAENKCSAVVELRNARYIRVDNYEAGQLITLGSEQWIVYPFYLKNTASRDGGNSLSHSGTFGCAVRYDGP